MNNHPIKPNTVLHRLLQMVADKVAEAFSATTGTAAMSDDAQLTVRAQTEESDNFANTKVDAHIED